MKFHTTLALIASYAVASFFTLVVADAITVQNDITQQIGPQFNTLNNDVASFPNSGLTGAVTIHSDVQTLVSTFNKAISDIQNTGSFSIVDGTTILADIQALVPIFLATLVNIGAEAPSWNAVPGGTALVLSDLQSLNTSFGNFLDALISAEPFLLKPGGLAIKAQITGAFTTAIAAYSVIG